MARQDSGQRSRWQGCVLVRSVLIAILLPFFDAEAQAVSGSAAAPAVVVPATSSANPGDERYLARMSRWLVTWMEQGGVAVRLGTESEFRGRLPDARVALLVAPSKVDAELLSGYREFLRGGGKLIVFYGSSEPLAELMGLRLGKYIADGSGTRFARIAFDAVRPDPVPEFVQQRSRNIRAAWPSQTGSRVLARWQDLSGRDAGAPAWLASKQGYWMTHVLLPDGGGASRSELLLGLCAACDPSLWRGAASKRAESARNVLRGPHPFARLEPLLRETPEGAQRSLAERLLSSARELDRKLTRLEESRTAWRMASELELALVEAFGAVQPSGARGERFAVWERTGEGPYAGDWDRACRLMAGAGVTDLFVHMLSPGMAHFPGGPWPESTLCSRQGDRLRSCLDAAKIYGIRVHAWVMVWPTEHAPEALVSKWRRQQRLVVDVNGKQRDWLEPSDPRNRSEVIAAIRDLIQRYEVSGVHLDYIRYPDGRSGFGAANLKRFSAANDAPSDWPRSAWTGADAQAFRTWRTDQISECVAQVQQVIEVERDDVLLSAAVFGGYPACIEGVAQDWHAWVRNGIVDVVCPMNYTTNLTKYQGFLAAQLGRNRADAVWPGIGVHANESTLDAVQTIEQIQAGRRFGAAGFVLYRLDRYLAERILPVLALGTTAK